MLVRLAFGRILESGPVHVRASGPSWPSGGIPSAESSAIGGLSPIALRGLTTLYSRCQASTFWHQSTGFDSGSSRVRELAIERTRFESRHSSHLDPYGKFAALTGGLRRYHRIRTCSRCGDASMLSQIAGTASRLDRDYLGPHTAPDPDNAHRQADVVLPP